MAIEYCDDLLEFLVNVSQELKILLNDTYKDLNYIETERVNLDAKTVIYSPPRFSELGQAAQPPSPPICSHQQTHGDYLGPNQSSQQQGYPDQQHPGQYLQQLQSGYLQHQPSADQQSCGYLAQHQTVCPQTGGYSCQQLGGYPDQQLAQPGGYPNALLQSSPGAGYPNLSPSGFSSLTTQPGGNERNSAWLTVASFYPN